MGRELEHFYHEYHFQKVNNVCYGIYKNYLFTFSTLPNLVKMSVELGKNVDEDAALEMAKKLETIKMNYHEVQKATFGNFSIDIYFLATFKVDAIILEVLQILVSNMQNLHLPGVDICPLCNRNLPSNAPIIKIGTIVYQVHLECFNHLKAAEEFKKRTVSFKKVEKRFYWSGMIGGVIGTLLFAFLWIFLYFKSMAIGLLPFLMLPFSKFLYELCRGKKDGKEFTILMVLNSVTILLAIFLGSVYQISLLENQSFLSSFSNYFLQLKQLHLYRHLLGTICISYFSLFLCAGVIKVLFRLRVDETSKIEIIRK